MNKNNGWIRITDKLPRNGQWAVWQNDEEVCQVARYKQDFGDHFFPQPPEFDLEDAVAWMPLPPCVHGEKYGVRMLGKKVGR